MLKLEKKITDYKNKKLKQCLINGFLQISFSAIVCMSCVCLIKYGYLPKYFLVIVYTSCWVTCQCCLFPHLRSSHRKLVWRHSEHQIKK